MGYHPTGRSALPVLNAALLTVVNLQPLSSTSSVATSNPVQLDQYADCGLAMRFKPLALPRRLWALKFRAKVGTTVLESLNAEPFSFGDKVAWPAPVL